MTRIEPHKVNQPAVDALGSGVISDYSRLVKDFGIKQITDVLKQYPSVKAHYSMERQVMFGHTDLEVIFDAMSKNQPFVVMTGIKPSGKYHVGSLSTVVEAKYFQEHGGRLSFAIADIETYVTTDLSFEKMNQIAIDNIADLLAMGISPDPGHTFIYKQSQDPVVQYYGHIFSNHVTYNMMKAIYGKKKRLGYYNSALILAADILRPQIVWGAIPTITPVGADQAPHARLTRDIAQKQEFVEQFGFVKPAFTYHSMLEGIDGSAKMSKSNEMSYFSLDEDLKSIEKKIDNALTGGRDTAEQQQKLGGNPDNCRVFDLFRFMFESETSELGNRSDRCKSGDLLCGSCKSDLKSQIAEFRNEFIEKKAQMIEIAEQLLVESVQEF